MGKELVTLVNYRFGYRAHILKAKLAEEGIDSNVTEKTYILEEQYTVGGLFTGIQAFKAKDGTTKVVFMVTNVDLTLERYLEYIKANLHDEIYVKEQKGLLVSEIKKCKAALGDKAKPGLLKPSWVSYKSSERGYSLVDGKWELVSEPSDGKDLETQPSP